MKSKYLKLNKPCNENLENMNLSACIPVITCWIILLFSFVPLHAQRSGPEIDQLRTEIQEAFIKDVVVISTALIEPTEDLPKHVRVRGYTMPSNYILIRLPVDDWNGKFFLGGCGAGCGELPVDITGNLKKALQRGYATATMNTGHWSPSIFDFSWAYNNPEAEKDFAYRAVHETLRASWEIIKTFYDRKPIHSYFWGCSNGGRQAVMAAGRYPEDFDGIISEAPGLSFSNVIMLLVWLRQTNTGPDGKDILTKEDIPLISKAVYNRCDEMDGKEDGLISDPVRCSFDPEVLICQDGTNCLSREKVEVLKKWYQGPVNANGAKLLTTGVTPGSEPFWGLWLLGESDEPFNELLNSESMLQNIAFREDPGDSYSVFEFDFNSDPDRLDYMGSLLDVKHLSLKSFKEKGGKLLMFHGLADAAVPYQLSVDYYNQNYKEYGEETNNFFRLFLVPGMDHCTVQTNLGITQDSADPLTALENWVEKDRPPHELPVTRFKQDGSVNSRFNVPLHVVRDK